MLVDINLMADLFVADPIDKHVLPSTLQVVEKECFREIGPHIRISKKKVLEESDYVESLEAIVERDFFPHATKLRKLLNQGNNSVSSQQLLTTPFTEKNEESTDDNNSQTSLSEARRDIGLDSFVSRYTSEDNMSFEEIQKKNIQEQRRRMHWMYEPVEDGQTSGSLMLYYLGDNVLTVEDRKRMDAILDRSDDKPSEYYTDSRPNRPELWPFRVRNQLMFPVELEDSKDICSIPKVNQSDNKQLQIQSDTSSTIHSLTQIENNSNDDFINNKINPALATKQPPLSDPINRNAIISPPVSNPVVGLMPPPEKRILHHNTRLRSSFLRTQNAPPSSSQPSPIEAPHTPSTISAAEDISLLPDDHQAAAVSLKSRSYRFVPMTPTPEPHASLDSPLMTWGEVCGTPMIIGTGGGPSQPSVESLSDADLLALELSVSSPAAGNFQIQGPSFREEIGLQLAKTTEKRGAGGGSSSSSLKRSRHATPLLSSTPVLTTTSSTGQKGRRSHVGNLTPAAQDLASRLLRRLSDQSDSSKIAPFGGQTPMRSSSATAASSRGASRHKTTGAHGGSRPRVESAVRTPVIVGLANSARTPQRSSVGPEVMIKKEHYSQPNDKVHEVKTDGLLHL